jgi:plastocyanin
LAALGLSVFVVGCGGGGGGQTSGNKTAQAPASGHSATDASHAPAGGQAAAPASGGAMNAVIRGTIAFEGTAAKGEALKMDADPVCKGLHSAPVTSQDVVVNANNTLRWVMVYVKDGLGGHTFPTPTEPVMIDQKGCVYDPHVIGMMANQPVKILNSDETLHNIHAMPKVNTGFNIGMPRKGMEQTKTFKEPEVPIHIKCDVHKWMSSYVGVFSHPFYGVTGENGSFELKGLPAGTYTIEAWHEKFGTQQASVTVGEAETKDVSFTFKAPA